jgi:hypothetical protein
VYIQIQISGATPEDHRKWFGWVESRLRSLIAKFEQTPHVLYAHPFPKSFDNTAPTEQFPYSSCYYMGLAFNLPKASNGKGVRSIDLTPAVSDFSFAINEWAERSPAMDLKVNYLKRNSLPDNVFEGTPRTGKRNEPEEDSAGQNGNSVPSPPSVRVPSPPGANGVSKRQRANSDSPPLPPDGSSQDAVPIMSALPPPDTNTNGTAMITNPTSTTTRAAPPTPPTKSVDNTINNTPTNVTGTNTAAPAAVKPVAPPVKMVPVVYNDDLDLSPPTPSIPVTVVPKKPALTLRLTSKPPITANGNTG